MACAHTREGEGDRKKKAHFFPSPLRGLASVSAPLPWLKYLGRAAYLMGLRLSPMPDQGLSGGAGTSRSRVIFGLF